LFSPELESRCPLMAFKCWHKAKDNIHVPTGLLTSSENPLGALF